jgi:CubicO group peptidase (beta-lactamase class C family)
LKDTVYEGVTVRQLLTMTSGVAFTEDYADPDSDIMRLYRDPPVEGMDATVGFVRQLGREAAPGELWRYKTPETNLAGVLVMAATGKPLAHYLSEKIWRPYGMEQDATWLVDHVGNEQGGCCLQAGLRDYARFGQFVIEGARIDGDSILPAGWLETATSPQADTGLPGGYGYQWWPLGDGTFQARGIFGQLIHVDPARELVVVISAAWPGPREQDRRRAQVGLVREFAAAIDAERAAH